MNAPIIAVYSLKGGVGKTTLAVNLAWAAATLSGRKTLLWDLDAQAAATFILGHDGDDKTSAESAIRRSGDLARLRCATPLAGLDLLPADSSLRDLDFIFRDIDKKKRLAKVAEDLAEPYDCVIIDCPPGLTDTSDQILRAADLVVVPVIPSQLSRRALAAIESHVAEKKGLDAVLFPVFSMVDRRRSIHRDALLANPDWPAIPMASSFEAMTERRAPLGSFTPRRSATVQAVAQAWSRIEQALAQAT